MVDGQREAAVCTGRRLEIVMRDVSGPFAERIALYLNVGLIAYSRVLYLEPKEIV